MDFLKVSDKTKAPCRSGSNQQQYKDIEMIHPHPHPHIISPYAGNGVMGCCYYCYPFTNAQLKELERQAMIYKYMIASIPVPFDLLVSSSSLCNNKNMAGSGDLEPGRCRRTDGKKWRCSKEVVSNHKYCERHLHRGRPRSRKHVEPPYSRPTNNALPNNRQSRGSEIFSASVTTNQENKYVNFIDIWSDGVKSSEKQNTTSSHVSSSNGDQSPYSLNLSMGGRDDPDGYGPYGMSSSFEEMSSWLAPMSAPLGGPLAEILEPYSLTATPSSSPSRVVNKTSGLVSDDNIHI